MVVVHPDRDFLDDIAGRLREVHIFQRCIGSLHRFEFH